MTMALTYDQIGAVEQDQVFLNRVVGALMAQCISINSEPAGTANHVQRLQLLGRVVNNPTQYAAIFAAIICSVAPINALSTPDSALDSDILSGVQSVWDAVAIRGI